MSLLAWCNWEPPTFAYVPAPLCDDVLERKKKVSRVSPEAQRRLRDWESRIGKGRATSADYAAMFEAWQRGMVPDMASTYKPVTWRLHPSGVSASEGFEPLDVPDCALVWPIYTRINGSPTDVANNVWRGPTTIRLLTRALAKDGFVGTGNGWWCVGRVFPENPGKLTATEQLANWLKHYAMRVESIDEHCERVQTENLDNAKWRARWEKLATSLWERRAK